MYCKQSFNYEISTADSHAYRFRMKIISCLLYWCYCLYIINVHYQVFIFDHYYQPSGPLSIIFCTDAMTKAKLVSIKDRLKHLNRTFFRKITNNESHRLCYLPPNPLEKTNLRNTNKFEPPKCRTKRFIPYALYNYQ